MPNPHSTSQNDLLGFVSVRARNTGKSLLSALIMPSPRFPAHVIPIFAKYVRNGIEQVVIAEYTLASTVLFIAFSPAEAVARV